MTIRRIGFGMTHPFGRTPSLAHAPLFAPDTVPSEGGRRMVSAHLFSTPDAT